MWRQISLPPISDERKSIIMPLVVLISFIVVIVIAFQVISRIRQTQQEITKLKGDVASLTAKKEVLSLIDIRRVQAQVALATRALPEKTALLPALARVRDVAGDLGIAIERVRVTRGSGVQVSASDLAIDVTATVITIKNFLQEVEESIPFIRATKGKLSVPLNGTVAEAELGLQTFNKKIPTTLPAVNAPAQQLTKDEEEFVATLQDFDERRVGTASAIPSSGLSRPNPFSY